MPFEEMKIAGAWIHTPVRHFDSRGHFEELFKHSAIEKELGRKFEVAQVNQSVSNRGVIRGIHFTDSDSGQAKYISCSKGKIWDVVVDLRENSPTYGDWDAALLSAENGKSVLISENLGHVFLSLQDGSVSTYLCSSEYSPDEDRGYNPFSRKIGISFNEMASTHGISEFLLSEKDSRAPDF